MRGSCARKEHPQGTLIALRDTVTHSSALFDCARYALATRVPEMGFHGLRQLDQRGETIDLERGHLFDVLDAVVP
ncbi:MAG: hypothetical protein AAF726_14325 [Planctomycetota bacterium]